MTHHVRQGRAREKTSQETTGTQASSISRFYWRARRLRVGDGRAIPCVSGQREGSGWVLVGCLMNSMVGREQSWPGGGGWKLLTDYGR